jgi:hypothetical protein
MHLSELTKSAPKFISDRYGSLNSYVWETLFPEDLKNRVMRRTHKRERKARFQSMKELVEEATLLAFIFVVHKTFIEGSVAAKNAVDTFRELGVPGFHLGKTYFSGRNEAVVLGDNLASEMLEVLRGEARQLVLNSNKLHEILEPYKDHISKVYA